MENLNRFLITLLLAFLLAVGASSIDTFCLSTYNTTNTNPSMTLDTFQTNLQTLFGEFRTNSSSIYGHSVVGKSPNKAYGLYLCRGDTTSDRCSTCIASLTEWVSPTDGCREAVSYADDCMIHYTNYSFIGKEQNTAPDSLVDSWKVDVAASFGEYSRTVAGVVEGLVAKVGNISAALTVRYGTREKTVAGGDGREKVYGLAQCTPDISQGYCSRCLKAAFSTIQGCCGGWKYAWAMLPSCQLRYDNASFYGSAAIEKSPAAKISPAVEVSPAVENTPAVENSPAVTASAAFPLVASWALSRLFLILFV